MRLNTLFKCIYTRANADVTLHTLFKYYTRANVNTNVTVYTLFKCNNTRTNMDVNLHNLFNNIIANATVTFLFSSVITIEQMI